MRKETARGEMEINMDGFKIGAKDVAGAARAFPTEHPHITGAVIGTAGLLLMDTNTVYGLQEHIQEGEKVGGIKAAVDYVTENWWWIVPSAATVNGLIDTVYDNKQIRAANEQTINAYHKAGKRAPQEELYEELTGSSFRTVWSQHVLQEGAQMVTATLAANSLVNGDNIDPVLRGVGTVGVSLAGFYAYMPDSQANKLTNGLNKLIGGLARGLQSVNTRFGN